MAQAPRSIKPVKPIMKTLMSWRLVFVESTFKCDLIIRIETTARPTILGIRFNQVMFWSNAIVVGKLSFMFNAISDKLIID